MKVKCFNNKQFSNDVAYAMQKFPDNNLNNDINDIDSHRPRIRKRVKSEKQPGWITHDLIKLLMHILETWPSAEDNITITNILETMLQLC